MIKLSSKFSVSQPDVFRCETSSGAGYLQDWHLHDCYMLLLPRRGSLSLSTEDGLGVAHISNRHFSMIAPDFGHATCAATRQESHVALYIDPEYIAHLGRKQGRSSLRLNSNVNAGLNLGLNLSIKPRRLWQSSRMLTDILALHDRLSETEQQDDREPRLHLINHLLFEECVHIMADSSTENLSTAKDNNATLVREIQTYITQNFCERLDIESVAYQFHLSRRHLTRIFKETSKETFVDFTNRSRVEHAHRLICDSHYSVLDAALAVGIDSPSYLAKLFKKYLGQLPKQCRHREQPSISVEF